MENARWKEKAILAYEVAKDYSVEKQIRIASHKGELVCPDPECKSPILKYCHGEIKEPYFAHRDNEACDYIRFEKSGKLFHSLRLKLYEHFKNSGYSVEMEVKVLKHHYSQLLIQWKNGNRTAIELGGKSTNVSDVEVINKEYKDAGIEVIWLVVDRLNANMTEKDTYFIKRYCLNETNGKNLIVMDYQGNYIMQYKEKAGELFAYESALEELHFENGMLTTYGFYEAYEDFFEDHKTKNIESTFIKEDKSIKEPTTLPVYQDYEMIKQSILNKMNQQLEVVRDVEGNRWIKCKYCGKVGKENEFVSYGGRGQVNLGTCKDCK